MPSRRVHLPVTYVKEAHDAAASSFLHVASLIQTLRCSFDEQGVPSMSENIQRSRQYFKDQASALETDVYQQPLKPDTHIVIKQNSGGANLLCPRCGNTYLHHRGVVAYDRSEDAETVLKTSVEVGKTTVQLVAQAESGNPSSRRDGLVIQFWCENCGGGDDGSSVIELTLAQHKGETEMAWRFTPMPVNA